MRKHVDERRLFHRVATDKRVLLQHGDQQHTGNVLDISLHGLLFVLRGAWRPHCGAVVQANVELDNGIPYIRMDGEVAHAEGNRVGLRCISLDLESAGMLRRMIELNLADSELLERDLTQLIAG